MLRAARFIAGYDLTPVPELVAAVAERASGSRSCRAERIRDELDKLIVVDHPRPGCGSSSTPAWPSTSCRSCRRCASSTTRSIATRTCSATPSPWSRTCGRRARRRRAYDFRITRLAALFHDVGKPATRGYQPARARRSTTTTSSGRG